MSEESTQTLLDARELADYARYLWEQSSDTQTELAEALGIRQPNISDAMMGRNITTARRIVEHYTGGKVRTLYQIDG